MSTGNPNYNVGGTAKDGGVSTADTVLDGGSDGGNRLSDETYVPSSGASGGSGFQTRSKTSESNTKTNEAHVGNPNRNVGGTAQDGGVSTADTVADGGPDAAEEDGDFKP
ncbi:hypothetical protein Slin15195_G031640 [Septoria linicola]|uniref:Uncharacterized protein n=1 Tax=Septoria linicola TaxID=215465 RepID=A0A9Q9EGC8_9PEZI|nr:hypothetical protein Slin15195_G031640 [Septoria linicola]